MRSESIPCVHVRPAIPHGFPPTSYWAPMRTEEQKTSDDTATPYFGSDTHTSAINSISWRVVELNKEKGSTPSDK